MHGQALLFNDSCGLCIISVVSAWAGIEGEGLRGWTIRWQNGFRTHKGVGLPFTAAQLTNNDGNSVTLITVGIDGAVGREAECIC